MHAQRQAQTEVHIHPNQTNPWMYIHRKKQHVAIPICTPHQLPLLLRLLLLLLLHLLWG